VAAEELDWTEAFQLELAEKIEAGQVDSMRAAVVA
jgi:hypothetical protein